MPLQHTVVTLVFVLGASLLGGPALAQTAATPAAPEASASSAVAQQPIVPKVDRREVKPGRIPSNDFSLGVFAGTYATQSFGTNAVTGLRLGYHITEDFFVEAAFGQTKVKDDQFPGLLPPGGIFPGDEVKISYYNISAGVNVLPGESFIGRTRAKASALYLVAGSGSTKFGDQKKQTLNYGFGFRVMLSNWASLQLDMRNHIFTLDLLGRNERTQNIEMSGGLTFFF